MTPRSLGSLDEHSRRGRVSDGCAKTMLRAPSARTRARPVVPGSPERLAAALGGLVCRWDLTKSDQHRMPNPGSGIHLVGNGSPKPWSVPGSNRRPPACKIAAGLLICSRLSQIWLSEARCRPTERRPCPSFPASPFQIRSRVTREPRSVDAHRTARTDPSQGTHTAAAVMRRGVTGDADGCRRASQAAGARRSTS